MRAREIQHRSRPSQVPERLAAQMRIERMVSQECEDKPDIALFVRILATMFHEHFLQRRPIGSDIFRVHRATHSTDRSQPARVSISSTHLSGPRRRGCR